MSYFDPTENGVFLKDGSIAVPRRGGSVDAPIRYDIVGGATHRKAGEKIHDQWPFINRSTKSPAPEYRNDGPNGELWPNIPIKLVEALETLQGMNLSWNEQSLPYGHPKLRHGIADNGPDGWYTGDLPGGRPITPEEKIKWG